MTAGQSAGAAKPTSTNAQWMRAHLGLLLTTIRLRYLYVSIVLYTTCIVRRIIDYYNAVVT